MAEKKHIQHLRSKVVENGKPKLPAVGTLAVGEIAVNYANGYETLSIENDASGITTFSSDDAYTKNKLGNLFSGDTTVTDVIKDDELIIASALVDLNEKKQDTLVSGTNIKTINNTSLLGEGNITISGGGSVTIDSELSEDSENPVQNKVITSTLNILDDGISNLENTFVERIEKPSTIYASTNSDYMTLNIPYLYGWGGDISDERNQVEFSAATSGSAGVMSAEDKRALDNKADSINIADYFPDGAKSGETMPRRAVYHYNGNILHSRNILINEGDTGGTEGDEEECIIFCYHNGMSTDVHGTYYYAFDSSNPNYYRYCYTWTYANAPWYIKQAFGEYTDPYITQVLTFNNPTNDDGGRGVYERVVERLSETPGVVVPVVWHDESDEFELFGDGEGGWLHGCAYLTLKHGTNKVVVDLYGVGYTDEVRAFVSLVITKASDNTYSYSEYFRDLDATATSGTSGLMSADDKIALDSLSGAVSNKADTTAVTQVNNALTAHTADTDVHVTSSEKTTWNNKSDFSGNYNDLTNKPTIPVVPTNVSAFNNDSGYITIDAISGKADSNTVYTKTEVDTALSGKQNTLTAGSGITISNDTISAKIWSGTKAAYEALTTKDSDTIYLIYNE